MRGRRALAALAVLLMAAAPLAAQRLPAFRRAAPPGDSTPEAAPGRRPFPERPLSERPWVRPVASLLVPGGGQLVGGQSRGLVYLAAELWIVSRAVATGRRGRDARAQYRALAYDVARRAFAAERVDGPFEYYETMEKYVESGAWDRDPGPAFSPETDSTTYNGFVWQLARRTFLPDPDSVVDPGSAPYQRALSFYVSRAITPQYQWSWRGARLEQDVFRGAIRSSDDAFRQRTNFFGALVLNHLASTIDALISVRLAHRSPVIPRVGVYGDPGGVTLLWTGSF